MGINQELAHKAEKRAREICRERGMPEGLWQMVLMDAYNDVFPIPRDDARTTEDHTEDTDATDD